MPEEEKEVKEVKEVKDGLEALSEKAEEAAAAVESKPTTGDTPSHPPEKEATTETKYEPNFSYTVNDEEKEVPEYLKSLIDSKEREDEIKDILTRADGLPFVKEGRDKYKQDFENLSGEHSQVRQEYENQSKAVAHLMGLAKKGDPVAIEEFRRQLEIPKEVLLSWAIEEARIQQLPPEERARYNKDWELREETRRLRMENEALSHRSMDAEVAALEREIDYEVSRPEVNTVMQAYDRQMGQVGAFRQLIKEQGAGMSQAIGNTAPVKQVIERVLKLTNSVAVPANGNGQTTQGAQPGAPAAKPPVIPNVRGSGSSVVGRPIRTLDDLKKLAEERS